MQNDWVRLAIACEVQKSLLKKGNRNKILFMHKKVLTLPVSFTGSYTEDEPNFPQQNNLVLQKKVSGVDKVVYFKDFIKTQYRNQDKYFSRT